MIIKGLRNIQKHVDNEREKNLTIWYARHGHIQRTSRKNSHYYGDEWIQNYDDELAGGRGLDYLFFDIPN